MLSYSGHGGQLPDMNTMSPTHRMKPVSLTTVKWWTTNSMPYGENSPRRPDSGLFRQLPQRHGHQACLLPGDVNLRAGAVGSKEVKYRPCARCSPPHLPQNKAFYDRILKAQDAQGKTAGGESHGSPHLRLPGQPAFLRWRFQRLFTGQLLKVWKKRSFQRRLQKVSPGDRPADAARPDSQLLQGRPANPKFEAQKPFTV